MASALRRASPWDLAQVSTANRPWRSVAVGDHRRGPQKGPDLAGQAVGPANVAGQEGNDKPPQLVYTEDGGVGSFAL